MAIKGLFYLKNIDPMTDKSYLSWPFFSAAHCALAADLEDWVQRHLGGEREEPGKEEEAVRRIARKLGEGGWLRYVVPKNNGGVTDRIDVRSICLIREILARHSGLADFTFAMQGLGSAPITLFGPESMKALYLPGITQGTHIAAFALSEPNSGSDVAAISTEARRDGNGYVLNGRKTWISNAGIASHYIVFARTGEAPGRKGLSAFVVDADTPGLVVSERIEVIAPHVLGTIDFKNCRVGEDRLLGSPGEGFKLAMATLDIFRCTVGAAALGFARRALAEALDRVKQREVFGQKLMSFQATQMRIADMALDIDAAALLIYRAAWAKDCVAERVTREASMAKLFATEAAQRVIDSAVQLLGGLGVTTGNPVERLYRDIRPLRIYEGTSEIQKLVIASQVME